MLKSLIILHSAKSCLVCLTNDKLRALKSSAIWVYGGVCLGGVSEFFWQVSGGVSLHVKGVSYKRKLALKMPKAGPFC